MIKSKAILKDLPFILREITSRDAKNTLRQVSDFKVNYSINLLKRFKLIDRNSGRVYDSFFIKIACSANK